MEVSTLRASLRALSKLGFNVAALALMAVTATAARANLDFPAPDADAGTVHVGAALAHPFAFRNTGSERVEITDLRASCGCLTPHLDKRVYAPGESGAIQLEVNTLTQPAGLQSWRVEVMYKLGSAAREQSLRLCAHMVREIEVQPAALVLIANGPLRHSITVTDLRAHPVSVTTVRSSAGALRVSMGRPASAGHYRIDVSLGTDYPEGRHEETISIFTDDPGYRELRVPVTVDRQPRRRIIARPPEVALRLAPGQTASSEIILLQDRSNEPIVVGSLRADDPAVTAKWAAGPGTRATVRVIVDRRKARSTTLNTVVHIRLEHPVSEELHVPVSCEVQGR